MLKLFNKKSKINQTVNNLKIDLTKMVDAEDSDEIKGEHFNPKALKSLKECHIVYGVNCDEINKTIKSATDIKKIVNEDEASDDSSSDQEDQEDQEDQDDESICFSSDSDQDIQVENQLNEEEASSRVIFFVFLKKKLNFLNSTVTKI
jgi:hypothetical protein